jgi:hypothetical protein
MSNIVERKGKYALVGPSSGGFNWWQIIDTENEYAVMDMKASLPHAEEIARYAWAQFPEAPNDR